MKDSGHPPNLDGIRRCWRILFPLQEFLVFKTNKLDFLCVEMFVIDFYNRILNPEIYDFFTVGLTFYGMLKNCFYWLLVMKRCEIFASFNYRLQVCKRHCDAQLN